MFGDKKIGECRKERFVGGRVGRTQIVHWIDDPNSKEPRPNSVHNGPRKIRVLRRSQPSGQRLAAIDSLDIF